MARPSLSPGVELHSPRTPAATTSQTPLDLLNGIITPSDLHYERHHAGVPAIDPARYSLTIHGMVDRSRKRGLPQRGPSMVQEFRSQIPLTAVAWTIAPRSTAATA